MAPLSLHSPLMPPSSSPSAAQQDATYSVLDWLFMNLIELTDSWLFIHCLTVLPALLLLSNLIWQRVRCDFDAAVEGYYDYAAVAATTAADGDNMRCRTSDNDDVDNSEFGPFASAPSAAAANAPATPSTGSAPASDTVAATTTTTDPSSLVNALSRVDDMERAVIAAASADIGCTVGGATSGPTTHMMPTRPRDEGKSGGSGSSRNNNSNSNKFVSHVIVAHCATTSCAPCCRRRGDNADATCAPATSRRDEGAAPATPSATLNANAVDATSSGAASSSSSAGVFVLLTRPAAARIVDGAAHSTSHIHQETPDTTCNIATFLLAGGHRIAINATKRRRHYRAFFLFLMAWQLHAGWFAAYASMVSPAWIPSVPSATSPSAAAGDNAGLSSVTGVTATTSSNIGMDATPIALLPEMPTFPAGRRQPPAPPTPLITGETYAVMSWIQGVLTVLVAAAWLAVVARPAFMRLFSFDDSPGAASSLPNGDAVESRFLAALDMALPHMASTRGWLLPTPPVAGRTPTETPVERGDAEPALAVVLPAALTLHRFTTIAMSPPRFYVDAAKRQARQQTDAAPTSQTATSRGRLGSLLRRLSHHDHPDSYARSYCRQCNAIVLGRDHHCWWLGVCIGRANRLQFLALCWAGCALGMYDVVLGSGILLTWVRRAAWIVAETAAVQPSTSVAAAADVMTASFATATGAPLSGWRNDFADAGTGGEGGSGTIFQFEIRALMASAAPLLLWIRALAVSAGSAGPEWLCSSNTGASTAAVPLHVGNAVACLELVLGVLLSVVLVAVCGAEAVTQTRLICRGGATKLGERIRRAASPAFIA